jgi:hypothetical protein
MARQLHKRSLFEALENRESRDVILRIEVNRAHLRGMVWYMKWMATAPRGRKDMRAECKILELTFSSLFISSPIQG